MNRLWRSTHCKLLQVNKPRWRVGSSVPMVLPLLCCRYGPEQGYGSFRRCLADCLTQETGHPVDAEELLITAGLPLPVTWMLCVDPVPHPCTQAQHVILALPRWCF
jgi:hypothetical protein